MKLRQCELESGNRRMTCWLEDRVHRGSRVTLKGIDGVWTVREVGVRLEADEINRKWAVGGLF